LAPIKEGHRIAAPDLDAIGCGDFGGSIAPPAEAQARDSALQPFCLRRS
jgi:hypothetical protein